MDQPSTTGLIYSLSPFGSFWVFLGPFGWLRAPQHPSVVLKPIVGPWIPRCGWCWDHAERGVAQPHVPAQCAQFLFAGGFGRIAAKIK